MKHNQILALSIFASLTATSANATPLHAYANAISGRNIAAIQHTIIETAFQSFEGISASKIYTAPMAQDLDIYGKMPTYGEYNDDGSAGRNGGDTINTDAMLNSIWFNWNHTNDTIHFDNFSDTKTSNNTFMMGLAGGTAKMGNGISEWGIYTGYAGSKQTNSEIETNGHGGYFGVYNGFDLNNFSLSTTLNGGVIDNSTDTAFGTDNFTNFWVGGAANASYNIQVDKTFTIRPTLHAGYTWIKSEDYTSASGDILRNDAFNAFELTPEIHAIKHIGDGWYGSLNAKYVMIFSDGGELHVNNVGVRDLNTGNFFEYGLSVEKSVQNFNFSATIGRHDGDRDGWIGGINIKHIF